jgi:transposase
MQAVTTIGLDIAKSIFQVHGVDAEGNVVVRRKLKRRYIVAFFQKLPRCLVGIEACASSHHWARELQALGHTVRLMPPAYVKPYVKRQKNDAADAEAICEAVTRANMRFVATKTPEQQSCLMLHRTRHLFIRQQTAVINAIRLFTPVEHAVLAAWLKLPTPAEATGIDLKHALAELGVSELPGGHYTYEDAGVVRILLESIERRLPSFAVSSITADGEQTLSFARQYRDPEGKPLRKTSLLPRPLSG